MITEQQIEGYLKEMGSTAEEVAEFLVSIKAYGLAGRSASCPVAYALKKKFQPTQVSVWGEVGSLWFVEADTEGLETRVEFQTPRVVAEFIERFDEGEWAKELDVYPAWYSQGGQ